MTQESILATPRGSLDFTKCWYRSSLNVILRETTGPKAWIFGIRQCLENLSYVYSNYAINIILVTGKRSVTMPPRYRCYSLFCCFDLNDYFLRLLTLKLICDKNHSQITIKISQKRRENLFCSNWYQLSTWFSCHG